MALTAPGIGSNLDVNGLVTQLMNIERRPLTLSQNRETKVNAQISAYGQLRSQVASLGDAMTSLGAASTMSAFAASIADTEVATATASSSAAGGTYQFEVRQLAQVEKVATASQVGGATTVMGTGDVTFTLGTYDTDLNTFVATAGKTPLVLHLADGNNSLSSIRDAINTAQQGFTASIVTDPGGARLVVSSAETGAANAISIAAPTIAALAFDPTAQGVQAVTRLQPAQNAKIRIDTLDIVSAANQVTGAIEGITINLLNAKPNTVTTLNVARDQAKTTAAIKQFVANYNALNALVREQTKYDPTSKSGGTLQGEVTAVSLQSQMRSIVSSSIAGTAGDLKTLNEIGLALQTDGSLKLDEAKLGRLTTTAADAAKVTRLFVTTATNTDTFSTRFKAFAERMQGTGGVLPSKVEGLQATVRRLDRDQAAFEARMVGVEARLRRQFNALDRNLASQNAVTSYLQSQELAWQAAAKQK